jgi:SAM-dependent methyltransferase
MENGKFFFDTYVKPLNQATVADIGAQNVNGSLKDVFPENATYIGVDFVQGKGVDIIIDDPYKLPFEDNSLDAIVSSSCFEHSEFFWLLFNEIMRVLKPTGLFYLNAPSNGLFHRYPVDCWRFYPDSGNALANWANRSGYNCGTTLWRSFSRTARTWTSTHTASSTASRTTATASSWARTAFSMSRSFRKTG